MLLAGRARGARRVAMTPLIDIVFILLLFFILETSFSEFRQMGLALTGASAGAQSGPVPLRLEVFADGRIWSGGSTLGVALRWRPRSICSWSWISAMCCVSTGSSGSICAHSRAPRHDPAGAFQARHPQHR